MRLLSTIGLLSIIPLLTGQQIGLGVDASGAIMRREIHKHIIEVVGNKSEARGTCDESNWPDKDHGLVCGECKVLVNHFDSKYKTCDGYCKIVGLDCANAWEESGDTCKVKHTMTCGQTLSSSDAICECAPQVTTPAPATSTAGPTAISTPAPGCDESNWPDKDHGLVCGECKVLVNHFESKYKTCNGYCRTVGLACANAWEESGDTCTVKHTMTCSQALSSSDAICECAPQSTAGPTTTATGPTTTAGPINIEFGGDQHGVNSNGLYNGEHYLTRPEAIKSKGCNANGCEDCSDPAKCFHGVSEGGWGYFVLDVPASSTFTHYVADMWARCRTSSTDASWWVEIHKVQNGKLKFYENDNFFDPSSFFKASGYGGDYTKKKLPITGEDNTRLRVLFYPVNLAERSLAKLFMEAWKVDASVEACMAVKDCLDLLGDGSDAAYELRNGNGAQLKCMSGDQSGMSSAVQAKCNVWDSCVTASGKKPHLLALLKAAIRPNMGLLEGVSVANETRLAADASTCVEPSIDDPESWDCECAEDMLATCSGGAYAGQELEECIQTLMCANSNVCCSWKQNHCASPTCAGALMEERSQVSTKVATNGKLHNGLDGATEGKCVM